MQESELIELLQKQETNSIEALLLHYGPLMRYVISPILPDLQDQEECISEIAMRVWEKISLYDQSRGSWNGWLTALSRNAALNRARQNKRVHTSQELAEEVRSDEPTPEELILQRERQAAVNLALRKLSPGERLLFYRKYYYLQSTAQIASELGLTERAVEGRLYRLKKQLRKTLGGEELE